MKLTDRGRGGGGGDGAYVSKPKSGFPRSEAERAQPEMKPALKPVF